MAGVGEQGLGHGKQLVGVLGDGAGPLPGVEHPGGGSLGQGGTAFSYEGFRQLGAGVGDDLGAEQAGRQLGAGEAHGLEGLVDEVGAEDPVAALDHDVQGALGAGQGEFLDQVAAEGGQVQVAAGGGRDGGLVGAVVEADGGDHRRLGPGEADPGAFGVLLRPAAVGVRAGDSDVDFKAGAIRVERQRLQSGLIGPPKTSKSRRTVPVGEVVTDALLAHLAARPSREWLFTMEEGEPLNYRRWKTEWNGARKALQAAENGAAEREGRKPVELPHMVTHDLRHFYASALIAGGASVKQVQLVLGHASAVITLRIYAHLWPGEEDRTRAVMDAVLGGLRPGCGLGDTATKEIAGQKR